jgi:hypothetical protein
MLRYLIVFINFIIFMRPLNDATDIVEVLE